MDMNETLQSIIFISVEDHQLMCCHIFGPQVYTEQFQIFMTGRNFSATGRKMVKRYNN